MGQPITGEPSPAQLAQRAAASRTHGLSSAFARTGDEQALQPAQREELAATREELSTPAGVHRAMVEHSANAVTVYRWGMAWLADKARREGPVSAFEAPMMQRFISVQESARRSLEALGRLPADDAGGDPGAITAKYRAADGPAAGGDTQGSNNAEHS